MIIELTGRENCMNIDSQNSNGEVNLKSSNIYVVNNELQIDQSTRYCTNSSGFSFRLGKSELKVFLFLHKNKGSVIYREELISISQGQSVSYNSLNVCISKLRRTLINTSLKISTVSGVGYVLH